MKHYLLCFFLALSPAFLDAQTILFNNGTVTKMNAGCVVYVQNGAAHNNQGQIQNAGQLIIDQNFVNDAQASSGGASGVYELKGDFVNNSVFTADQGLVLLNGANQQITGNSITTFYDLELAGTGVKSMTLNEFVSHNLKLNDRQLATGVSTMFVTNSATNAISENGGFVSSTGNGRLSRVTSLATGYYFPVGSSVGTQRIRPLMISPSSGSSNTYAVRFVNNDPTADGFDRSLSSAAVCTINDKYYHLIDHATGTSSINIGMYYLSAQDGAWDGIGHWQNIPQWENTGNSVSGISGVYNTMTIGNWSNFSLPPFALIKFGASPAVSQAGNLLIASGGGLSYQWFYNGNPIPGANGTTYDAFESGSGTYYVQVTYASGCIGTSEILEITIQIGIDDIDGLSNLTIYPNPGDGKLIITGDLQSPQNLVMSFTDVLGRKIREDFNITHCVTIKENIDLSDQADGVYFITIYSNSGRNVVRYIKN